eukprot:TRINITY_DN25733_c0_g1_i1.p1 TRINITY_DN25733_c0_g1~~TRINITY_DN25733_c0_g1_i1.p1  ORF type:complete len:220 (-),score=-21.25 TRINITY_DN25733_c0_g1_i1:89-721(-)
MYENLVNYIIQIIISKITNLQIILIKLFRFIAQFQCQEQKRVNSLIGVLLGHQTLFCQRQKMFYKKLIYLYERDELDVSQNSDKWYLDQRESTVLYISQQMEFKIKHLFIDICHFLFIIYVCNRNIRLYEACHKYNQLLCCQRILMIQLLCLFWLQLILCSIYSQILQMKQLCQKVVEQQHQCIYLCLFQQFVLYADTQFIVQSMYLYTR